ncbi:hypothetical protein V6N11_075281 [Hibiscus sabdariffa]|uniref:Uncharacterized protein n=1 Tax=Hibiscus sabdariffa TaxID=183260 RepID=A0ABR2R622_9ROSI
MGFLQFKSNQELVADGRWTLSKLQPKQQPVFEACRRRFASVAVESFGRRMRPADKQRYYYKFGTFVQCSTSPRTGASFRAFPMP